MILNPDHTYNHALIDINDNIFNQDLSNLLSRKFLINANTTPSALSDLVDLYYQIQDVRVSIADFKNDLEANASAFNFYSAYLLQVENHLSTIFMDHNAKSVTGNWAISQLGIGQAMSASLLVLIDINKASNVSTLWKFAGLDPQHDKWNPDLKSLTWKIAKSFEYYSEQEDCFYGHLYLRDLNRRITLNENGQYAKAAQQDAAAVDGKLPLSRLKAQARRYAVKIFLSHWHHIRHREVLGVDPSNIFKDSNSYIQPPNFPY